MLQSSLDLDTDLYLKFSGEFVHHSFDVSPLNPHLLGFIASIALELLSISTLEEKCIL